MVTGGEGEGAIWRLGVGVYKPYRCKIGYKDVLYNMGNLKQRKLKKKNILSSLRKDKMHSC